MMICHCSLAGTQACKNCSRYKEYFGEQINNISTLDVNTLWLKEELAEVIKKELADKDKRPKGKWIKGDMFECDQCHHRMIVGDGAYNYCPCCGADIRGEE